MTPADLAAWQAALGYNKQEAAFVLGIGRATLNRYLDGKAPIPKLVVLACAAVAQGDR